MRIASMTRRGLAVTAAAGITLAVSLAGATPASAAGTSKVSVVHGIPGTPVDVYVNGTKTLPNFQPKAVAGPLDLPEGAYDLVVTAVGADPAASPIIKLDDVPVPAGKNLTLVAHLKTDGSPTITAFVNDVSTVAAGKARLVVRHTAQAPAVDVRAGGTPVFPGLTNPNEAKGDVAAGTVQADVVAAGTATVVLGPAPLTLAEGTATIVYAIGSLDKKTLDLTSQTITGLHSAPGGVPTGDGGLASTGAPFWLYALAAAGVLLLLGGAATAVKARR